MRFSFLRRLAVPFLAGTACLVVFGSQYLRQISTQPGTGRTAAGFALSFTDAKEFQWMTIGCLGIYCLTLIGCIRFLRKGGEAGSGQKPDDGPAWPELLLALFLAFGFFQYVSNYEKAYLRSDFLTAVAGITAGQAVLWLHLWRKSRAHAGALAERLVPFFVLLLGGAAFLHPYMGRSFQYRDEVRWMGPYFNPNTYGALMGAGLVLAAGSLVKCFRPWSVASRVRPSLLPGRSGAAWLVILFYVAAVFATSVGLAKSYSRAAWFGVGPALLYLLWTGLALLRAENAGRVETVGRWRERLRPFVPVAILLGLALGVVAFWALRDTEHRVIRRALSIANQNDFSWRNRATTSMGALQMISDKPFTGFGWNQLESSYNAFYRPNELLEGYAICLNDYLVIGMTLGLPTLACLFLYVICKFAAGHGTLTGGLPPSAALWNMAVCRAACVVLLVSFIPQRGLFYLALAAPFWMLLELGAERPSAAAAASAEENGPVEKDVARFLLRKKVGFAVLGLVLLGTGGYLLFRSRAGTEAVPMDPGYLEIQGRLLASQPMAVNVSPDGRYVLTKEDLQDGFRIGIRETGSSRLVISNHSANSQRSLTWRPDSQALLFQEISGLDRPLCLFDFKSGLKTRLELPVSRTALPPLRWDPDGNRFAYFHGDWSKGRLLVTDPQQNEEPAELLGAMSGTCDFAWAPDGNTLATTTASKPDTVLLTALDTLDSSEIKMPAGAEIESLAWAPDGESLLVAARRKEDEHFGLFETKAKGGSFFIRAVAQGDIGNPLWLPDGQFFLYHVLSDGIVQAVLGSRSQPFLRTVGPTNGVLRVTHASPDGGKLYARFASLTAPPVLLEITVATDEARVLYAPPGSERVRCPAPQSIRIASFDGTEIPAYHWKSARTSGPPSAVLIDVHGGLHTQTFPAWESYVQIMVEKGCDVIALNYRGSSGFGHHFENLGDEADRVKDVVAARDFAVDVLKAAPARVYLMGNSHGSGLIAAAAAHGKEIGGLVLISWAGQVRDVPPRLAKPFKILGFQGNLDPFVSPQAAQASIAGYFAPAKNVSLETKSFAFRNEGHFFYDVESWARICWEISLLMETTSPAK